MFFKIFIIIRYYFDLFIDYIYGFYYKRFNKPIPNSNNPIILESATSLAEKIKNRQLKCETIINAFISRINDVNYLLNAIIDNCFDDALKQAKDIDRKIENGEINEEDFKKKPFLGVPFTTKETTSCKNLSNTFGLIQRKGIKAECDAYVIEQIKNAGGILLGVTNVPQLNLWQETSNPIYGITNNPYDITRNVGGSSGGEASIIAAGGSPFGIGTDIGGSIRIPSFMCGIYGHKPTGNLISTRGLTFRTGEESDTMVSAGPMVKYTEDLIPILKVLLGDNVTQLNLDQPVDIKNLKIYYVNNPKDPFVSPIRPEMKNILKKAVGYFEEILSEKPKELSFEEMKYGGKLWRYWMTQEPYANFKNDINNRKGEINTFMEILKYLIGYRHFNLAIIFYLIKEILPKDDPEWIKKTTNDLKKKLIEILGTNGVLIYPSAPWPASYHHTAFFRPWNFNLFGIWNVLKFPVTQVPMGLSHDGLPLGLQIVSAPYQDHLTITVAEKLEKVFGGYVPPFQSV